MPLTQTLSGTNTQVIGYRSYSSLNILWGTGANPPLPLTYFDYERPSSTTVLVRNNLSDFTFVQGLFFNISCSYLSDNTIFQQGVDNLDNVQIIQYCTSGTTSGADPSTYTYTNFSWQTTYTSNNILIYDKTDDICTIQVASYFTPLQGHQYYYISKSSNRWHFKTENGYIFFSSGSNALIRVIIRNASRHFPSLANL